MNICCRGQIGLTAAAFGLGLLLSALLPSCIVVIVAAIILTAGGILLFAVC